MNFERIDILTANQKEPDTSVMIVYTGGTMGMERDSINALIPIDFQRILEKIPSLRQLNLRLSVVSFKKPLDSSNIHPTHWVEIAKIIESNYAKMDGFVILHGTDTMAYSASALSFILEGLSKPVIFTGAQLPLSAARSDARENLITAILIASSKSGNNPIISEVGIYFDNYLLRGNRSKKVESSHFDAFKSENYPSLGISGVEIEYNKAYIHQPDASENLTLNKKYSTSVAILKLFPGINKDVVNSILNISDLKGLILETFGSGNAPTDTWFIDSLEKSVSNNLIVLNVSQCDGGKVNQGMYETSKQLQNIGVLNGSDITTEAAVTKLMFLLGKGKSLDWVKEQLITTIC